MERRISVWRTTASRVEMTGKTLKMALFSRHFRKILDCRFLRKVEFL